MNILHGMGRDYTRWEGLIGKLTNSNLEPLEFEPTFKKTLHLIKLSSTQIDDRCTSLAQHLVKYYPDPDDQTIKFAAELYKSGGLRIKKILNCKTSPFSGKLVNKRDYKAEAITRLKKIYKDDESLGFPTVAYLENSSGQALTRYAAQVKKCDQHGLNDQLKRWQDSLPKDGGEQFVTEKMVADLKARLAVHEPSIDDPSADAPDDDKEEQSDHDDHNDDEGHEMPGDHENQEACENSKDHEVQETINLEPVTNEDDTGTPEVEVEVISEKTDIEHKEVEGRTAVESLDCQDSGYGDVDEPLEPSGDTSVAEDQPSSSRPDIHRLDDHEIWIGTGAACPPDVLHVDPINPHIDNIVPLPQTKLVAVTHCQSDHWVMGLISPSKHTCEIYNSAKSTPINTQFIARLEAIGNHVRKCLSLSTSTSQKWQVEYVDCAQQTHDYDCGIYMLVNFLYRTSNMPAPKEIDGQTWRTIFSYWWGPKSSTIVGAGQIRFLKDITVTAPIDPDLLVDLEHRDTLYSQLKTIVNNDFLAPLQSIKLRDDLAIAAKLGKDVASDLDSLQANLTNSSTNVQALMAGPIRHLKKQKTRIMCYIESRSSHESGLSKVIKAIENDIHLVDQAEDAWRIAQEEPIEEEIQALTATLMETSQRLNKLFERRKRMKRKRDSTD